MRAKSESNRSGIVAFLSAFWTSFGGKYTCVSELLEKYQCTRRYSIVLELSQTKPDFNFKKSKYCSGTRSWRQQSQGPGAMGLTPDDNLTSCCCKSQLSDLQDYQCLSVKDGFALHQREPYLWDADYNAVTVACTRSRGKLMRLPERCLA